MPDQPPDEAVSTDASVVRAAAYVYRIADFQTRHKVRGDGTATTEYTGRFRVVKRGRPSTETAIILKRTGMDLTNVKQLALIVRGSGGRLHSDGVHVWTDKAEEARKNAAAARRRETEARRALYRRAR